MRSISLVPNRRLSFCSRFGLRDTPSRAEPSSKSVTSAQTASLGVEDYSRPFVDNLEDERTLESQVVISRSDSFLPGGEIYGSE